VAGRGSPFKQVAACVPVALRWNAVVIHTEKVVASRSSDGNIFHRPAAFVHWFLSFTCPPLLHKRRILIKFCSPKGTKSPFLSLSPLAIRALISLTDSVSGRKKLPDQVAAGRFRRISPLRLRGKRLELGDWEMFDFLHFPTLSLSVRIGTALLFHPLASIHGRPFD
jgi:hypothetical protein